MSDREEKVREHVESVTADYGKALADPAFEQTNDAKIGMHMMPMLQLLKQIAVELAILNDTLRRRS